MKLSPEEYKLNIKTMIKLIFWRYFEINTCFVSSIIGSVEFPKRRVSEVINRFYRGEKNDFINRIQNG